MLSHQIFVLLVNNLRLKLDLTLIIKTLSSLNNLGNRDHAVRILIDDYNISYELFYGNILANLTIDNYFDLYSLLHRNHDSDRYL